MRAQRRSWKAESARVNERTAGAPAATAEATAEAPWPRASTKNVMQACHGDFSGAKRLQCSCFQISNQSVASKPQPQLTWNRLVIAGISALIPLAGGCRGGLRGSNNSVTVPDPIALSQAQPTPSSLAPSLTQPSLTSRGKSWKDGKEPAREYRGLANTTITFLDAFGKREAVKSFQTPIIVGTGRPKQAAGMVENNPFTFFVGPDAARVPAGQEGQIQLHSAVVLRTPQTARLVLLQYWDITFAGHQLRGRLSDNHRREAAVLNFVTTYDNFVPGRPAMGGTLMPHPIRNGAILRGTLDSQEVQLHLEGTAQNRTRTFVATITAARAK